MLPRSSLVELDSSGVLFFFFQAEDGIRDYKVTGVQTWLFRSPSANWVDALCSTMALSTRCRKRSAVARFSVTIDSVCAEPRSEERRVGKRVDLGGRRIIKKKKEHNYRTL